MMTIKEAWLVSTGWITSVMMINSAVVAAEERVNTKVAELLTAVMQERDTTEGERLLVAYGQALVRLRAIQSEQLQAMAIEE